MKPRTKYQKQVVTSNKGLRPIKGAQMQWAFRECLDHYAFQLKHGQTTCMDCGHTLPWSKSIPESSHFCGCDTFSNSIGNFREFIWSNNCNDC